MIKRGRGYRRDHGDNRDRKFSAPRTLLALPPAIDLRASMPPIQDQGDIGSCVLNAFTSLLRWHVIRGGGADVPLSRLALYWRVRELEGTLGEDAGCEPRNAIKVIRKFGAPPESLWAYDQKKFNDVPPRNALDYGAMFGTLSYERVPCRAYDIKAALFMGFPVVIGLSLFESFDALSVERTGVVKLPLSDENETGGHAMLCVGYGQRPGHFTVANSWSEDWGDKGYCYIPESYVGSRLGSDYWTIRNLGGV